MVLIKHNYHLQRPSLMTAIKVVLVLMPQYLVLTEALLILSWCVTSPVGQLLSLRFTRDFGTFRAEDSSRSSLELPRFPFQGRVSACGLQALEVEQSCDSFLVLIIRQNGFCFSLLFAR